MQGRRGKITPREVSKRERGKGTNPRDVVKLLTLHPERPLGHFNETLVADYFLLLVSHPHQ